VHTTFAFLSIILLLRNLSVYQKKLTIIGLFFQKKELNYLWRIIYKGYLPEVGGFINGWQR
jgi:hypothetical protein